MWANSRGRNGFLWTLLALLISPLISAIILAILPNLKDEQGKKGKLESTKEQKSKDKRADKEKKRGITSKDFITSIESLKKLYDKNIISELEYKNKKLNLIDSLNNKVFIEGKDGFLTGLIPSVENGLLTQDDIRVIKLTINY